jgi:hypothetical protein
MLLSLSLSHTQALWAMNSALHTPLFLTTSHTPVLHLAQPALAGLTGSPLVTVRRTRSPSHCCTLFNDAQLTWYSFEQWTHCDTLLQCAQLTVKLPDSIMCLAI